MDELPPLEHRDDPFKLLGVTPEVDEKELKRAYARRIKVYRPDRAPEQFALIHAAYEHVRMMRHLMHAHSAAAERAVAETVSPPSAPDRATPEQVDVALPSRELVEAVAREDHAAAAVAWKTLRATAASLEDLIVDAPPPIQSWIIDNVPLTWRELSQWRDPQAAFNVWMSRFARCVRDKDRLPLAVEMASEPALLTDAAQEARPAVLALTAVSALAWRDHDLAESLLRKLRSVVHHPLVTGLHDRATLDVDQAGREYRIHGKPPLPAHVLELLADGPVLAPAERGELEGKLRTSLRTDAVEYLDHLSGTAKRHPRLAEALTHRLLDGVPPHRRELQSLPDVLRDKLAVEMRAASRKAPWVLTLLIVVLGVVTVAAAGVALAPQIAKEENYFYVLVAISGAYLGAAYLLDQFLYQTKVRPLLAVAIARAGVTRAAAREWLRKNRRRAFRLFRFGYWMHEDDALRLVGMLAGYVADDRGD